MEKYLAEIIKERMIENGWRTSNPDYGAIMFEKKLPFAKRFFEIDDGEVAAYVRIETFHSTQYIE